MPTTTSRPAPTTFCVVCEKSVAVNWYQNENDPGDRGMRRSCGHAVPTEFI